MTPIRLITIFLIFLSFPMDYCAQAEKIKGITVVASPSEYKTNPIEPIENVSANWICLVPYGFSKQDEPRVRYNINWQWWGERPEGVKESIRLAHRSDIKVMLKPQVYIHEGWIGYVDFETEKEWLEWEKSYRNFIFFWLQISIENDVEMFCIGTEYVIAAQKREKYWRQLISDMREIYCGKLVYSSNWDAFEKIPFWDALDYIGLSAYFPLSEEDTPSKKDLEQVWKPIVERLKSLSGKVDRPLLFTEFGYLSVDGCAGKTWLLEDKVHSLPINEEAQKNAYDALFEVFWNEDFWAGGFLWKWFPEMKGHEGYPERDYTPQGKLSEKVVKKWYSELKP